MRVAMLPPARTRHRLSPGYRQLSRQHWIQVQFGRVKDRGPLNRDVYSRRRATLDQNPPSRFTSNSR